jgi:hypothetical protein
MIKARCVTHGTPQSIEQICVSAAPPCARAVSDRRGPFVKKRYQLCQNEIEQNRQKIPKIATSHHLLIIHSKIEKTTFPRTSP